jgi:hypothetical protein
MGGINVYIGSPTIPGVTGNRVPFAASSDYNQALTDVFGGEPPLHPESDQMIEALRSAWNFDTGLPVTSERHYRFTTSTTQFTLPVYIVEADTPLVTMSWTGRFGEYTQSTGSIDSSSGSFQIPLDPTWAAPPPYWPADGGADCQIIVWDRDNVLGNGGEFWDMWRVEVDGSGVPTTTGPGGTYECVNASHYSGELGSDGVPVSEYVSRGAGVPYIVGLVRAWELEQEAAQEGTLGHALGFSFSSPSSEYVVPATKSDGVGDAPGDVGAGEPYSVPEGAIIRLDPDFDYSHLDAEGRVLARTLIEKGAYCIDNAGRPKIYLEADVSAGWAVLPSDEILAQIPIEAFRVVDFVGGNTGRTTGTSGYGTGVNAWSAGLDGGIVGNPAVQGTPVTGTATSGTTVASASQSPAADELLIALVAQNETRDRFVTALTGNDGSLGWTANGWRSYIRRGITLQNGNGWLEMLVSRADASPTAGAVTATPSVAPSSSAPAVSQAIRVTADAKPVRCATRSCTASDTNASTEPVTLKDTESGALLLGIVLQRNGDVSSVDTADGTWTATGAQVAAGSFPDRIGLRAYTLTSPGGDVSFQPTLSTTTEWELVLVEIT